MKSTWIKYISTWFCKTKIQIYFSEKITHIDIELKSKRKFHEKEKCEREKWPPHVFLLVWSLTILRQKDTPQSTHFLT